MIINFNKFLLEMANLTINDLNKDNDRWNNLFNNLKNNNKFELNNGNLVNIKNTEEIISNISDSNGKLNIGKATNYFFNNGRYTKVINTTNGLKKLNDFKKVNDYGSSRGTSSGSEYAEKSEIIQSLFFSLRQIKRRDLYTNDTILIKYDDNDDYIIYDELFNFIKSEKVIDISDYTKFKKWRDTYIETANIVFDKLDQNKTYIFYHNKYEGIPTLIKNKFIKLIKNIDTSLRINISKWNPSDIYIINNNMIDEIYREIDNVETLDSLRFVMDKYFNSSDLIGISLKKISNDVNIKLIVNKEDTVYFKYDSVIVSKEPLESMSVTINAKSYSKYKQGRTEQFISRIFTGDNMSNFNLEIKGKSSMHGKVNINFINFILKSYGIKNKIEDYKDLKNIDNNILIDKIYELYNKCSKTLEYTNKNNNSINYNISNIKSKLISKYQSLKLVEIFQTYNNTYYNNSNETITNKIISELFYYGYSMNNKIFENTKYYRIIEL